MSKTYIVGLRGIVIIELALCLLCLILGYICGRTTQVEIDTANEKRLENLPIIYDSESEPSNEDIVFCPSCGKNASVTHVDVVEASSMSEEILCDNKGCDHYGVPIKVTYSD